MKNSELELNLEQLFSIEAFTELLNLFPEPFCIFSKNDQQLPDIMLYANDVAQQLLSITNHTIDTYTFHAIFQLKHEIDFQTIQTYNTSLQNSLEFEASIHGNNVWIRLNNFIAANSSSYYLLTFGQTAVNQKVNDKIKTTIAEFESLFKYHPDMVFSINDKGQFTKLNTAGLQKLGYSLEEITAMNFRELIADNDVEQLNRCFQTILEGNVQKFQIQLKNKEATTFYADVLAVPLLIDHKITGIIGVAKDITKSIETNFRLKESEEKYRALFDYNIDPVITFDLEGRFIKFNEATEKILDTQKEDLVGASFLPFIVEELQEETWKHFRQVMKGQPYQYETSIYNKEGEPIYLHITLIPAIINDTIAYIHCIGKDITHQKQNEQILHNMVYYDNLTGLGNHRLFSGDLQKMMQYTSTKRLAVCMIDLDRFKFVNDYLGHEAGDQLLYTVASRITKKIDKQGKVYRYSGDAFALLIPNLSEEQTELLASELIRQISKAYNLEGVQYMLTASIGISFYPFHGLTEKELVRTADHAMYHAKKQGRNQYKFYNSTIQGLVHSDLQMEIALHKALENQEFSIHYQPQFDAVSGSLQGLEALIRWNNPTLGMVSPAKFIPLAEETGSIVPIGEWVIEEACRQIVHWNKKGIPLLPISINLSLRQFYQANLLEKVKEIIQKTGIDPNYIMFEITETMAMQEDIARVTIQKLKLLGIKIAMDDFGTGYSSLNYLQTFSIDHLKIDKAFIDKLETKEGWAIVKTIISLGHHLNMTVVAEGVETATQVELLKALQCNLFQGYYFSRPLSVHEIEQQFLNNLTN